MKNKNLLIGGAVVAGLLFLYFRSRNNGGSEERSSDAGLASGGGGALASENGGGAVMQTTAPILVAPVKKQPSVKQKPTITPNILGSSSPKPYNTSTGGAFPTILGSSSAKPYNTSTGSMQLDLSKFTSLGQKSNFLTFDGDTDAQNGRLDFEGNI